MNRFIKDINMMRCQWVLYLLAFCPLLCYGGGKLEKKLDQAWKVIEDDAEQAESILMSVSEKEYESGTDEMKFYYHYFFSYVDDMLMRNSDEKMAHLMKAKGICETKLGIHSDEYLEVVWSIGKEYIDRGDSLMALKVYRRGLVQTIGFYKKIEDENLSGMYEDMEKYVRECYNDSTMRRRSVEDRFVEPVRNNNNKQESSFDYTKGLSRKDIEIITKAKDNQQHSQVYINSGKVQEGEALLLENITMLKERGLIDKAIFRQTLDDLGALYCYLENHKEAQRYLHDAKYLYERYYDFGQKYFRCLSRCAAVESRLGKGYLACVLIDVALDIAYDYAKGHNNISLAYLLSNAYVVYDNYDYSEEAYRLAECSYEFAKRNGRVDGQLIYNLAASYFWRGNYDRALQLSREAYKMAEYEQLKMSSGLMVLFLSHIYKDTVEVDVAVETSGVIKGNVSKMFKFLSEDQRANYWESYKTILGNMSFYLYESKDEKTYGVVYDNIIYEKGLLLRTSNQIKRAIDEIGDSSYVEAYNEMLALRAKAFTETDKKKKEEYEQEAKWLDKYLMANITEYEEFLRMSEVDWRQIREGLKDEDVAIEFYDIPEYQYSENLDSLKSEHRYCAVILRRDYQYPKIVPLCKEEDFLAKLEKGDDLYKSYNETAIYEMIWKPIEEELKGVKNIYFAADRELHKVGIEYALMSEKTRMNDVYNMYRLSSTREVVSGEKKAEKAYAVMYGGLDYDMDMEQLIADSRNLGNHTGVAQRAAEMRGQRGLYAKYLPQTKVEVEKIGELFDSAGVGYRTMIGTQGTEESFRLIDSKVNILHIATHGFFLSDETVERNIFANFLSNIDKQEKFEDRSLMKSGLYMAGVNIGLRGDELPDDVEDGVLTAKELSTMNLGNIDLVVLSACQSGLGEATGEGVFGLQRGFKLAGAKSLLMSLWSVDDEATQMLMTEFYRNILLGRTKIESLREAQQHVKEEMGDNPYYWAAFVMLDGVE